MGVLREKFKSIKKISIMGVLKEKFKLIKKIIIMEVLQEKLKENNKINILKVHSILKLEKLNLLQLLCQLK